MTRPISGRFALMSLVSACFLSLTFLGLCRATAQTQTILTGGKTTTAASTTTYASKNTPAGPAPTAPVDGDGWYDSTQNAEAFQQSTNTTVFRGGAISGCINVSPVTVNADTTSGQDLMSCTIPAELLNTVGKTLKVWIAGFYTIPSGATGGTLTMSVQLGGNDICKRTPGANYVASSTNNPWEMTCYITTQTAGTSGKFEAQGIYTILNNATQTANVATYPLLNTTTVPTGTVDTMLAVTLQVVVTFSNNQVSANSAIQRQMIVEVVN
jgi:hypothetical protein